MRSFERIGNISMPETKCERGSRATRKTMASDTRIDDLSEGGSRITHEAMREE